MEKQNSEGLKRVPLSEIKPDPKQPRKFFDDAAINELAENIRMHGVLQPILLRPAGKGYMIVFGERRFRASQRAKAGSIPATIKAMSDEEALEIQLMENLHRENPHPMEEAVAFKAYLEMKQYSIEEIAAKLGKKNYYIKQRLKLNDLLVVWQKLFFQNSILVSDALKIAQLPYPDQQTFYIDEVDEDEAEKPHYKFEFNEHTLSKYKGELHKATFSLSDNKLNPKMGACTNCTFNTAYATLFQGDEHAPRCTNISCFKAKTKTAFDNKLKEALDDSTIVFVQDYCGSGNAKAIKEITKKHTIYKRGREASFIEEPTKPDWTEFVEDNEHRHLSPEELDQEFQDELKDYDQQFKAYKNKISTGKYQKAFVADGDNAGAYMFVEIRKSETAAALSADPNEAIRQEIERIKAVEEEAKENDHIAIHKAVKETLKQHEPFINSGNMFSLPELIALAVTFFDYTEAGKIFITAFKIEPNNKIDLFKKLNKLEPANAMAMINKYLRHYLVQRMVGVINDSPQASGTAAAIRKVADQYIPAVISEVEKEQRKIASKRSENATKKIAELQTELDTARMFTKTSKKGIKSLLTDGKKA